MSDPSALSSRLRDQRSRKRFLDKQISVLDLWPSIRLHDIRPPSIKLHGIKFQGIRPHSAELLNVSGLSRDLFLPIRMANPRLTNQGTSWRNRRRWRMINSIGSCLFRCRAWYSGWIIRWSPVNNHQKEGRHSPLEDSYERDFFVRWSDWPIR